MSYLQPKTTLQGGKYRIERVLGQGGFGITYLAEQVSTKKRVAIKELFIASQGQAINERRGNQVTVTNAANQVTFDKHKDKFKKEALRLSKFHHSNLVRVSEYFEENNTAYYVMSYIEGESLRNKLNHEGALSESLVQNYLRQSLPALEVVHRVKIWHLDIKPENIMVDKNGKVYLIDFGASKHIEQAGTLTTSSAMAFTPGYYPPEQLSPDMHNIGAWTDIYALGATLYNLLTKKNPPTFDVIFSEGSNAFSFPSYISSSTRELIIKMMNPDKKKRPQTIGEVMSCLESNKKSTKVDTNSIARKTNDALDGKVAKTTRDYIYALLQALMLAFGGGSIVIGLLTVILILARVFFNFHSDVSTYAYPLIILIYASSFIYCFYKSIHDE